MTIDALFRVKTDMKRVLIVFKISQVFNIFGQILIISYNHYIPWKIDQIEVSSITRIG